jgi:hypothetical protein
MVAKAHALGLSPGWYLNNCGCAENKFEGDMIEKVMAGSVRMLVRFSSLSSNHVSLAIMLCALKRIRMLAWCSVWNAIRIHAFALLEALPCMGPNGISRVHILTG